MYKVGDQVTDLTDWVLTGGGPKDTVLNQLTTIGRTDPASQRLYEELQRDWPPGKVIVAIVRESHAAAFQRSPDGNSYSILVKRF